MESAREKGTDNGCDSSLLFTGCGMQNLEKDIIKSIDSKLSQSGECMINMSEITTFKWDRMAVYDSDIKGRDVIKALGLENYGYDSEFSCGIIFVNGKDIVYIEYNLY